MFYLQGNQRRFECHRTQHYLGLMARIWASLGFDVAIFQHFTRLQAFIRGIVIYCDCFHSKTGINNMIQYAKGSLSLAYSW